MCLTNMLATSLPPDAASAKADENNVPDQHGSRRSFRVMR
jgi:hypothetical protein